MRRRRNQQRALAERNSLQQQQSSSGGPAASSSSPKSPDGKSFRGVVIAMGIFLGTIFVVVLSFKISRIREASTSSQEVTTPGGGIVYHSSAAADATTISVLPPELLVQLDAILLLSDGEQSSESQWCDDVLQVVEKRHELLTMTAARSKRKKRKKNFGDATQPFPILPLDAAIENSETKHNSSGESASVKEAMSCLGRNANLDDKVWVAETPVAAEQSTNRRASIDYSAYYRMIAQAFYARTVHTDTMGWETVLVVAHENRVDLIRIIFDWIFGFPGRDRRYNVYYLAYGQTSSSNKTDTSQTKAIAEDSNLPALVKTYRSLQQVWKFIHDHNNNAMPLKIEM